jgi:hypothetical protein
MITMLFKETGSRSHDSTVFKKQKKYDWALQDETGRVGVDPTKIAHLLHGMPAASPFPQLLFPGHLLCVT